MNGTLEQKKTVIVQMPVDLHLRLRKMAYLTNLSMSELVRNAVKKSIDDTKDLLTNADIVL